MTGFNGNCTSPCEYAQGHDDPRLAVVTGGPGACEAAVLEMARWTLYRHVVVLPEAAGIVFGYDHSNPLRVERADQAQEIDDRIEAAWRDHPRRTVIEGTADLPAKASRALATIDAELPTCCNPART